MNNSFVAVLMGSDSDLPTMQASLAVLEKFGVAKEVKITSAHRTPAATHAYVKDADARGCKLFIAAAGLAAHLAGTIAGLTIKPVIGVPMDTGPLNGIDALLSTVQMPGGVPVASMAIGTAGAVNAGYLAVQILALSDATLAQKLLQDREANEQLIRDKDAAALQKLSN
ncbi:MAG: 5-(carboxyamino)imidazole ribonucleotide mutase [Gammaproteobacteria bacterium RIFCSPLOWO2_02_FULL_52_10]|nr:MAG: 5-(carboxyamino)imidazole ribonucleotide mutase [Gammaproteobacteria bacterium RIFCSPLOWO2_02_FULL_52_10]